MNTVVYIDGFNFYYGCLKSTQYKWLDIYKLFNECVLPSSHPSYNSVNGCQVRYFTAPITELAAKNIDSVSSQMKYVRALGLLYPEEKLSVINGYYDISKRPARNVEDGKPIRQSSLVDVWHIEEKQADVNLALAIYRDAMLSGVENIIVCGNDSDIAPALEMVKLDKPEINVGLVVPVLNCEDEANVKRSPNKALKKHADWIRTHINEEELAACQLPNFIPAKRKGVKKPPTW